MPLDMANSKIKCERPLHSGETTAGDCVGPTDDPDAVTERNFCFCRMSNPFSPAFQHVAKLLLTALCGSSGVGCKCPCVCCVGSDVVLKTRCVSSATPRCRSYVPSEVTFAMQTDAKAA